jgi:hypothetical protein
MLGEEAYNAVVGVLTLDKNAEVQDFSWILTEYADTDEVYSPLVNSELFSDFEYGPSYTKEMEQYISDNFGEFVDNIVYLLGLEINGVNVESLTELLNGLVGGSLYNSDIVISIRDAIAGLVDGLVSDIPAGAHILEILRTAKIADLKAIGAVEVAEFTDDRDAFVAAICDVLEPIFPVLEWLLADVDLTFFVDENKNDIVTLLGAEGYAFGLIPVLEVIGCENILTIDEYNAAVKADRDVLLTSILNPLLDRVDVILEDPANEILAILPNLVYFLNSNGVDTVIKNTLNAVFTLLNAIEPIAKIDLYALIGLDLETLTFEKLFNMLLEIVAEKTGYNLETIDVNTIAELTVGKVESYTSANGKTAYRMVYQSTEAKDEMVTTVLRLAVLFVGLEENVDAIVGILESSFGMSEDAKKFVKGTLDVLAECLTGTQAGMDLALAIIFYAFYGLDTGVDNTTGGYRDLNDAWKDVYETIRKNDSKAGAIIEEIFDWDIFEDIFDSEEGLAPNGLIAFFQKIASWFQNIINWFKNLFN